MPTNNSDLPTTDFATNLQSVRDAFAMLAARAADIGELIEPDLPIAPATMGQLLMTVLDPDNTPMTRAQKVYWLEVAEHMGPDFVQALRRAAAFAGKTNEF